VDVGGTGVRVRISNVADSRQFIDHPHVKVNSAVQFYELFRQLDASMKDLVAGATCRGSAFALAGLRKGDCVTVMNWPEPNEKRTVDLHQIPVEVCPPHHTVLLNDLEACAYGVVSAGETGEIDQFFEQLCGPAGATVIAKGNTAVMAMGSGLGAALVARDFTGQKPIVLATEFGWCLAALVGPNHKDYAEARGLYTFGSSAYEGVSGPIYEDMASGHGLVMDYDYLMGKKCGLSAGEIAEKAKGGDALAKKAMTMHYIYFTKCAKMMAISLKCDSIVMSLSNQVANRWLIEEIKDQMTAELNDTIWKERTSRMSIFSQVKECNFNILGTTYMAHRAVDAEL
jgi:glucokinase